MKVLPKSVLVLGLAVLLLTEARPESGADVAEAIRLLEELEKYYSKASRPRIDRRDVSEESFVDPGKLDRAVRLLQLQTLDRIYSYHTRPRFGKRDEIAYNWAKDSEKPEFPAWLNIIRR